jgi:hypothetical protein
VLFARLVGDAFVREADELGERRVRSVVATRQRRDEAGAGSGRYRPLDNAPPNVSIRKRNLATRISCELRGKLGLMPQRARPA